jgi:hypothetical protein
MPPDLLCVLDHIPRQDRQPVDLPAHVYRCTMQVDALDIPIRAQHPLALRTPLIPTSAPATRHTRSPTLARTPGGRPSRCALPARPRLPVSTSSSRVLRQSRDRAAGSVVSDDLHVPLHTFALKHGLMPIDQSTQYLNPAVQRRSACFATRPPAAGAAARVSALVLLRSPVSPRLPERRCLYRNLQNLRSGL